MIRSRSLIALLSLALSLVVLGGCGQGDSPAGKTVITFWHFWSEPSQKAALEERVRAFEQANPEVDVQLSELSWGDGKTKLLAAFNSQTAPDVLELGSDWIAQFSSAGVLADQEAIDSAANADVTPEVAAPGMWKGKTYARPWVVDTRVLFVNTGLLGESGVDTADAAGTWSQVLDRAEAVRAHDQTVYGFGADGPDTHRLYKRILPFFWSNGGEVLDDHGRPVINSPQNVAALQMYLQLAGTGLVESQKELDQLFLNGKIAYWFSGSWLVDRIRQENPSLRYRAVPLPRFDDKPAVSFAGGEYLAINDASEHKELAMKFVAFLTSGEQSLAFARQLPGLFVPADLKAAADSTMHTSVRNAFTEQLAHARMTPVNPKWLDIESIIEEEASEAILAHKDAQQALDDAQARLQALLGAGDVAAK